MSKATKIILLLATIATTSFVLVWFKYSVEEPIINDISGEITIEPITIEPEPTRPKPEPEIITLDLPDYSSLEKDSLYTEEEGSYENLSKEGRELLRYVICNGNNRCGGSGYGEDWPVVKTKIISLHKNIICLLIPIGKGGSYYLFFDLKTGKIIGEPYSFFGTEIKNDDFVILVKNEEDSQSLLYYKLGMTQFHPIPNSVLPKDDSYEYHVGMGLMDSEWNISSNILNISIFLNERDNTDTMWKKLREITFDLNQLP